MIPDLEINRPQSQFQVVETWNKGNSKRGSPNRLQMFGLNGLDNFYQSTVFIKIVQTGLDVQNLTKSVRVWTSMTSDSDTAGPQKYPTHIPFPTLSSPCGVYPYPRRPPMPLYHSAITHALLDLRSSNQTPASLCLCRRATTDPAAAQVPSSHVAAVHGGHHTNMCLAKCHSINFGIVVVDFEGNTIAAYSVAEDESLCQA